MSYVLDLRAEAHMRAQRVIAADGQVLEPQPSAGCDGCHFEGCSWSCDRVPCRSDEREDGKSVIWVCQ